MRTSEAEGLAPQPSMRWLKFPGQGRGDRALEFRGHGLNQLVDAGQGLRRHGLQPELVTRLAEHLPHAQDALGTPPRRAPGPWTGFPNATTILVAGPAMAGPAGCCAPLAISIASYVETG